MLTHAVLCASEEDQEAPEEEVVVDEATGEVSGGGGGGRVGRLEAVLLHLVKAATRIQEDKDERDAEVLSLLAFLVQKYEY